MRSSEHENLAEIILGDYKDSRPDWPSDFFVNGRRCGKLIHYLDGLIYTGAFDFGPDLSDAVLCGRYHESINHWFHYQFFFSLRYYESFKLKPLILTVLIELYNRSECQELRDCLRTQFKVEDGDHILNNIRECLLVVLGECESSEVVFWNFSDDSRASIDVEQISIVSRQYWELPQQACEKERMLMLTKDKVKEFRRAEAAFNRRVKFAHRRF